MYEGYTHENASKLASKIMYHSRFWHFNFVAIVIAPSFFLSFRLVSEITCKIQILDVRFSLYSVRLKFFCSYEFSAMDYREYFIADAVLSYQLKAESLAHLFISGSFCDDNFPLSSGGSRNLLGIFCCSPAKTKTSRAKIDTMKVKESNIKHRTSFTKKMNLRISK